MYIYNSNDKPSAKQKLNCFFMYICLYQRQLQQFSEYSFYLYIMLRIKNCREKCGYNRFEIKRSEAPLIITD